MQSDIELAVRVSGASRSFGERVALAEVDFELGGGQIAALVGPNGSGKTTLLKLIAGFLRADAGDVRVLGRDPVRERTAIMRDARFAFAPPALFDGLSAREHVRHLAGIGGVRVEVAEVERALATVGLAERADERVRGFSFGMRQRLVLAQALVPVPKLVVLDEPTDGLDPLAVLELREVLRRLRDEHGTSILLSSHLMVEVEELVDHMLVLAEGREVFRGRPRALTEGAERLVLVTDEARRANEVLGARGIEVTCRGERELLLDPDAIALDAAVDLLRTAGLELREYRIERPTLERALLERLRVAAEERS